MYIIKGAPNAQSDHQPPQYIHRICLYDHDKDKNNNVTV